MDSLPLEIVHAIASADMQTYHAMMTAYPRYSRSIPAIPREGYIDRFDMMIHFGFDVQVGPNYRVRYIEWTLNGLTHMNAEPAVIHEDGTRTWYRWGKKHRDGDLPAQIACDGTTIYVKRGKIHRDGDQPAYCHADGTRQWYQHGYLHRDDDKPASIAGSNRIIAWYLDGRLYRDGNLPVQLILYNYKPQAIYNHRSAVNLTEAERDEYLRDLRERGYIDD